MLQLTCLLYTLCEETATISDIICINKLSFDKLFAVTFTATMYKYMEQSKILQKSGFK